MTRDFGVGIIFQKGIPLDLITSFESELQSVGVTVEVEERDAGIYASLEWVIPTAVVVYLAKPYFEGFLSEAGKDHYQALRGAMVRVINRLFSSTKTPKRLSPLFSVQVSSKSGESVKFVFAEGFDQEQYEVIVTALNELMVDHFRSSDGGRLETLLQIKEGRPNSHYLEYSDELAQWIAIDTMAEIRKLHGKSKE